MIESAPKSIRLLATTVTLLKKSNGASNKDDTYNIGVPGNGSDAAAAGSHLSQVAHAASTDAGARVRKGEHFALGFKIPDNGVSCG